MDMAIAKAAMAYAKALDGAKKAPGNAAAGAAAPGASFADLLESAAGSTLATEKAGEKAAIGALTKNTDMADVVAAVNNAEVTLETVVAVRNDVISAYQSIIQMPI